MSNIAIVVGNTDYQNLAKLDCCHDDLVAIQKLLEAAAKYDEIAVIENTDADDLKLRIRNAVDKYSQANELFFYFTGHGLQLESEFFFCATNFDSRRPNETGLSTADLHTLLKLANADLVVKVIDACNSGTLLVKADAELLLQNKQGFKNLIQIASCLDSQNSLTGNPLSLFTEKFRTAVLRKTEGAIYYTDIIDSLRDEFLTSNSQTPHFVSQGTGREQFVDDAKCFDAIRAMLRENAAAKENQVAAAAHSPPPQVTLLDMLGQAESKLAKPEIIKTFVNAFFDGLTKTLSADEFAEFFDFEAIEHPDFREETARAFIIRVLSKETRQDNFVTATISKKFRKRSPWDITAHLASQFTNAFGADEDVIEMYNLDLNCKMERVQLKVTLTPKYSSLKRLVLVVTCAPSLETCYVFEIVTQHQLIDFVQFDSEGTEVVRRWYKMGWHDSTSGLIKKITAKLNEIVKEHLDGTAKRLSAN